MIARLHGKFDRFTEPQRFLLLLSGLLVLQAVDALCGANQLLVITVLLPVAWSRILYTERARREVMERYQRKRRRQLRIEHPRLGDPEVPR